MSKFKKKLVIVLLSTLISLLVVEILLRQFLPQENLYFWRYDENGVTLYEPNFKGLVGVMPRRILDANLARSRDFLPKDYNPSICAHRLGRYSHPKRDHYLEMEVAINSNGERDDQSHSFEKKSDLRALFIGASVTFGWSLPLEDTFIKQLSRLVPGLETVNCGIIGGNTALAHKSYSNRCRKYKSDVVIVQLSYSGGPYRPDSISIDRLGSDYNEIAALISKGWMDILNQLIRVDGNSKTLFLSLNDRDKELVQTITGERFKTKFPFYHQLNISRLIKNYLFTSMEELAIPFAFTYIEDRLATVAPPKTSATLHYLKKIRSEVEAQGQKLIVFMVPDVVGHCRMKVNKNPPALLSLRKEIRENKFNYVDLTESLADLPTEEIYPIDESHLNANGNLKIAQALKSEFIRLGLIKK